MDVDASSRRVLLLHDGDLADVRALLVRLGVEVVESSKAATEGAWEVAVANARHVRAIPRVAAGARGVRIAVLDRNTRTLRSLLRRSGVDLIVCRPVHPAALRGLLLHALYRGPERRSRRVAVGSPVRFRAGLRRRSAVLADLSVRGCLLISREPMRVGTQLVVYLPDMRTQGRSFAVRGRVVRSVSASGGEPGGDGFAVAFSSVDKDTALLLKDAVAAHLEGPALCADAPAPAAESPPLPEAAAAPPAAEPAAAAAPADAEAAGTRYARGSTRREVVRAPRSFEVPTEASAAPKAPGDRRGGPRGAISGRRVVALGDEAARVLIGRDLSAGGMRVERTQALRLGQRFRIALHGGPGESPLVVHAEVSRDDGLAGFVLRFRDLGESAERYLVKMVDSLPVLAARNSAAEGVVVSEILEADES
ncbi:MAG TPA: PilZ domain-containing protein [Myxococcota bacterium]|nr:PilZ domain-containing protein [Myxococcota bacterium]